MLDWLNSQKVIGTVEYTNKGFKLIDTIIRGSNFEGNDILKEILLRKVGSKPYVSNVEALEFECKTTSIALPFLAHCSWKKF